MKVNCWELRKCGREPGGANVSEFGLCPAATEARVDGMNRGAKGGARLLGHRRHVLRRGGAGLLRCEARDLSGM